MSATAALAQSLKQIKLPKAISAKPMITPKSTKRSRSTMGSFGFDMSEFTEASQQVEDSIAFPSIEWSFDDSASDDGSFSFQPSAKRRCIGLVRSKSSADLSTYTEPQRCGSSGSLC